MKKILAILSDNEEIREIADKIIKRREGYIERVKFLKKQARDEKAKSDEDNKSGWDQIRELVKKKLPKDYDEKKYTLGISIDEDALYIEDEEEQQDPFTRIILSSLRPPE